MNAKVEKVESQEARIERLEALVAELSSKVNKPKAESREMTADDARRILYGDLKEASHKEASKVLNLSYGQVYSCRLEFTFKAIHKEMSEKGVKNRWTKS